MDAGRRSDGAVTRPTCRSAAGASDRRCGHGAAYRNRCNNFRPGTCGSGKHRIRIAPCTKLVGSRVTTGVEFEFSPRNCAIQYTDHGCCFRAHCVSKDGPHCQCWHGIRRASHASAFGTHPAWQVGGQCEVDDELAGAGFVAILRVEAFWVERAEGGRMGCHS